MTPRSTRTSTRVNLKKPPVFSGCSKSKPVVVQQVSGRGPRVGGWLAMPRLQG